jgi:hypothetical protein
MKKYKLFQAQQPTPSIPCNLTQQSIIRIEIPEILKNSFSYMCPYCLVVLALLLYPLTESLVHGLVSQLDTEESSGIGGHGTSKGGTETREEGLDAALAVQLANNAADSDVTL